MNGTCAGGTGAFLDQMASLLNTDTAGLTNLFLNSGKYVNGPPKNATFPLIGLPQANPDIVLASLLNTDTAGLNELAKGYQTIYPIASRCGVFAKTFHLHMFHSYVVLQIFQNK